MVSDMSSRYLTGSFRSVIEILQAAAIESFYCEITLIIAILPVFGRKKLLLRVNRKTFIRNNKKVINWTIRKFCSL